MIYDFSDSFSAKELVLEEFIDNHTTYFMMNDEGIDATVMEYYKEIFALLHGSFEQDEMITLFEQLAAYKTGQEIPYVIVSNEVHSLMYLLISSVNKRGNSQDIVGLLKLFREVDNSIAQIYLQRYIDALVSLNRARRNSLADLVEKKIISYYESHLEWLSKLALNIKDEKRDNFVELDHCRCNFGKWLHNDAKEIIQNNSKYLAIVTIHKNLHMLAQKIYNILEKKEYHILINYLEKCELMSLGIGTELALLDNIIINKKAAKDSLTGALNRQGLRNIFQTHYELALATSNSFILAICDLDHFKLLNDTYGHVAGDKVLQHFVAVVKRNLRNSDVIIRYGGEEFVIMLPSIHKENGLKAMQNICSDFAASTLLFDNQEIRSTVSIGMIEVEPSHPYANDFLNEYIVQADKKLYCAKGNGRNCVEA